MSEAALQDDPFAPIEGVVIEADEVGLSGDVHMRVTQGAARDRVKGFPTPVSDEDAARGRKTANDKRKVTNRYNVALRAREMGVDPTEIICLLLQNTPEARAKLNLPPNAKTTPALMGKLATELLSYMAPKLKSVQVKEGDGKKGGGSGVKLFMPVNGREEQAEGDEEIMELRVEDLADVAMALRDDEDDD